MLFFNIYNENMTLFTSTYLFKFLFEEKKQTGSPYPCCFAAPKEPADNCYPTAPPAGQDVPQSAPGSRGRPSPPAST